MDVYGLCSAQETPSVCETPLLWLRERNCVQRMRDNLRQTPKTAGNRSFSLTTLDIVYFGGYATNTIFRDSQFRYVSIICTFSTLA